MKYKIISIIIIIILIFGCWRVYTKINENKKNQKKYQKQANKGTPVTIAKIEYRTLTKKINLIGDVEAYLKAEISAKITGVIDKINCELGDYVKKDDVIIKINDKEYQEQLNNANISYKLVLVSYEKQKIELENLKSQYERTKELYQNNLTSKENFENIEAKYRIAEANLKYLETQIEQEKIKIQQSQINLDYTIIRAPFSGFISDIYYQNGSLATAGKVILSMVDISKIKIQFDISEMYYPLIKKEIPVKFKVPGLSQEFSGKITNISPILDNKNRSAKIEVTVNNNNYLLKPGMTANIILDIMKYENIPVVPLDAIYTINGEQGIFLINEDDTVKFVKIEILASENNVAGISLLNGEIIKPEQRIVLIGGYTLKTGDKVIIIEESGNKKTGKKKKMEN
ncbi:MAG TPA: efflux RND transporter periplasmic adaptor subunit [bacterium]|nr:efflux RND transporter periplasmic adaptor subunit [bacterium]HOL48191.1 efflux RND transporter periplasmic adaptor subunit [bacterium]HPQ19608.1 efflux RND transporter periplasmic adaptor subunit [bacterium]